MSRMPVGDRPDEPVDHVVAREEGRAGDDAVRADAAGEALAAAEREVHPAGLGAPRKAVVVRLTAVAGHDAVLADHLRAAAGPRVGRVELRQRVAARLGLRARRGVDAALGADRDHRQDEPGSKGLHPHGRSPSTIHSGR